MLLALPNDVRWAEIACACWRSGLVLAPVSLHLGPDELCPLVEDARPAAVVVGPEAAGGVRAAVAAVGVPEPAWLVVGAGYDEAVAATPPDPDLPETMGGRLLFSSGPAYHSAPMSFLHAVHQLGGTVVTTRRFDAETRWPRSNWWGPIVHEYYGSSEGYGRGPATSAASTRTATCT